MQAASAAGQPTVPGRRPRTASGDGTAPRGSPAVRYPMPRGERTEDAGEIGEDRVTAVPEGGQGALRSLGVAEATRVLDQHGDEAEVRRVPGGGLDSDLQRDARQQHRGEAEVAQEQGERRPLEG